MSKKADASEVKVEKSNELVNLLLKRIVPVILLVIVSIGATAALIKNKPEVLGLAVNENPHSEVAALLKDIENLISLPPDEFPMLITVSDAEKEKALQYFDKAVEGDKILLYQNAKKVILYRPSEKRIIDFGIIASNGEVKETSAPVPATAVPTQTYKFALYNGTEIVGATRDIEVSLKSYINGAEISERAVASRTDYADTILVDLSGLRAEDARRVAETLKISLGALPEGEKKPENADFLILVGSKQ